MGIQQILFIVLSIIIVTIAIAGGLTLFKLNAIKANRRACITDMNNFADMNQVYAEFFGENPPARSCVEVSRLPKDVDVEIEVIALVQ